MADSGSCWVPFYLLLLELLCTEAVIKLHKHLQPLHAAGQATPGPMDVIDDWSIDNEDRQLVQAARRAAGIWMDKHKNSSMYSDHVVVTASTTGFGDFLRNWICRAEALRMRYLAVALDQPLYVTLTKGYDPQGTVMYPAAGPGATVALHNVERRHNLTAGAVSGSLHMFRHDRFNDLSCGKIRAVAPMLRAGLNVLFVDADAAMLRVPIPMIPLDADVHYAYQADLSPRVDPQCGEVGDAGNTGVYWARASPQMVKWFLAVGDMCRQNPHWDDQENFWQLYRRIKADLGLEIGSVCGTPREQQPNGGYVCPVSPCVAPNGFVQADPRPERILSWLKGVPPVLVHPNFLMGGDSKRYLLRNLSLWMIDGPELNCIASRQQLFTKAWGVPAEDDGPTGAVQMLRRSSIARRFALMVGYYTLVGVCIRCGYHCCRSDRHRNVI